MDIEDLSLGGEDEMAREPKIDPDELSAAERAGLRDRIVSRMTELNLKIAQVVERSKISSAEVYKYRNATKKNPNIKQLRALARALECPVAYLLGLTNDTGLRKATTIPIIGEAAVGVYKSVEAAKRQHGEIADVAPLDVRFADADRFSIPVRDNHLDGLSPPVGPGHLALVVRFNPAEMDIESGKIYLVNRIDRDGRIETAFWRVLVFRDRYEFAPVSRDSAFNERNKFAAARRGFENSDTVQIDGLFYGTSFQYS